MKNDFSEKLEKLSSDQFERYESGSEELIEGVEAGLQVKLPDDYKELLLLSDGGSIIGSKTTFNYEPSENLVGHNMSEFFKTNIPGMIVIGDDGGGCIYYYDPHNRHGKGVWSLHFVSMGALFFEKSVFVGKSLTEMIDKILQGEHFGDMLFK